MDVSGKLSTFYKVLKRKKVYESVEDINSGNLKRCLNKWDLTALGVGSTLGVGAYVVVGNVAKNIAGPSVVISFLLAALASLFAGLCYAEFGARVPKAGSAYVYSYVCMGELIAFIIGWNLILEYMIGAASVSRALSLYVDSMVNRSMTEFFQMYAPIGVPWMSSYFDAFAFSVVIVFGLALSFGMRESSTVNNALSAVNIAVVLFVTVAGATVANAANWRIPAIDIPADVDAGVGGFFPYGVSGTIQGAAICFYGFIGFDCITTTGEEVKEPRKAIPFAILLSLVVIFLGYFGVSTVITMMVPYYLQDIEAPVPSAFSAVGWEWARWMVAVGATFGLCASLYGAMFPLPRIIYAMATDGLIFRCLGHVTEGRKSPVVATLISTAITAILGAIFRLRDLIAMISLGTLLAYTIVAACVLLLRYRTDIEVVEWEQPAHEMTFLVGPGEKPTCRAVFMQLLGIGDRKPTRLTSNIAMWCLMLYTSACIAVGLVRLYVVEFLIPVAGLVGFALVPVIVIALQPKSKKQLTFMVPLVPLIPCLSIFANIYLMLMLDFETWKRFLIWIAIGLPVYFICIYIYGHHRPKIQSNGHLRGNINKAFDDKNKNKSSVTIVVQSPTPPTIRRTDDNRQEEMRKVVNKPVFVSQFSEPTILNHVSRQDNIYDIELEAINKHDIDNKLDKETKAIELLDQVLEAEEELYPEDFDKETASEDVSRTNTPEITDAEVIGIVENSDGESVESVGGITPIYDIVAEVHREDLPKVEEDDEGKSSADLVEIKAEDEEREEILNEIIEANNVELDDEIKSINELISHSDSSQEPIQFNISSLEQSNTASESNLTDDDIDDSKADDKPIIPIPPPMDESYFAAPLKRANTIIVVPRKNTDDTDDEEQLKKHERTFSISSVDEKTIVFGSDRQVDFMNKLSTILLTKPATSKSAPRRSISTSHILDLDKEREQNQQLEQPRPVIKLDLKKELMARHGKSNGQLKPKVIVTKESTTDAVQDENKASDDDEDAPDNSMSRQDLKSKLENIFAAGGPNMMKPRLMKSNPPTPELQTEESSVDEVFNSKSLSPLKEKAEKSDTLKLQKAKFGDVLNSFKISMVKDTKL